MKVEPESSRREHENKDAIENYANTWRHCRKHRASACRMITVTSFISVVIIFESVHVSANTLNLENERLKCIYLAKKRTHKAAVNHIKNAPTWRTNYTAVFGPPFALVGISIRSEESNYHSSAPFWCPKLLKPRLVWEIWGELNRTGSDFAKDDSSPNLRLEFSLRSSKNYLPSVCNLALARVCPKVSPSSPQPRLREW